MIVCNEHLTYDIYFFVKFFIYWGTGVYKTLIRCLSSYYGAYGVCNNCSIPLGKGLREALYNKSIINHSFIYLTYECLDLPELFGKVIQ